MSEIISNWKEVVDLTEKKESDAFEKLAVPPGEIFFRTPQLFGVARTLGAIQIIRDNFLALF